MKLAYSTLACPGWDMDTIIAKATEFGYDGVDFRGYQGELQVFKLPEFSTKINETARRFSDAGLEVPCLSSGAFMFSNEEAKNEEYLEEVKAYAPMCGPFGAKFVRVFGGRLKGTSWPAATESAAKNLARMAEVARQHDITILAETHDEWLDCNHMRAVMELVNSDSVGVLWDTHHPCRILGEKPQTTWDATGKWIQNTHWKDSTTDDSKEGGHRLCLFGEGSIPIDEIYGVLKRGGYDGYLTFEWEKIWRKDLQEPEVALPGFVTRMRKLMAAG